MKKPTWREGQKYGMLSPMWPSGYSGKTIRINWLCLCDCGNTASVEISSMLTGHTKSCGCLKEEVRRTIGARIDNTRHGMTGSSEHSAFCSAKSRCTNAKYYKYRDYGARGIKFLFSSFEQFIECVGKKPHPSMSIDRIDNDGHYEPGNVRWATPKQQANNRRIRRSDEIHTAI